MKLYIDFDIPKGLIISYQTKMISIGSCFATNIGRRLSEGKFDILSNPFGILYNPISIAQTLLRIIENRPFLADELVEYQGLWHSWMHHGSFSGMDKDDVLEKMNASLSLVHKKLKSTQLLMITLGSAYTYRHKADDVVVANCHKFPSSVFEKERLTVEETESVFSNLFERLKYFNPSLEIMMTVSPIRHIRDGIIESQRSKSVLLLAVEKLCETKNVSYFPSYEIMMDELRDYRFYKSDMIHPNEVAIDYIWNKFKETYFDETTTRNYSKILKIVRGFQHRVLHPNTQEHHYFIQMQIEKANKIMAETSVDFNSEIDQFKGQLQLFKD